MMKLLELATAQTPLSVPTGDYILVNGLLGIGEWDTAASVQLDSETELKVKKDQASLFLGVVCKGPRHTGIDLYLKSADRVRMLHISSALGEREFQEEQWSEMQWGSNDWWTANQIGLIAEEGKQRIIAPDAFEFQIARTQLEQEVGVYLHLKRPEKRFPQGEFQGAPERWLHLTLK